MIKGRLTAGGDIRQSKGGAATASKKKVEVNARREMLRAKFASLMGGGLSVMNVAMRIQKTESIPTTTLRRDVTAIRRAMKHEQTDPLLDGLNFDDDFLFGD